MFVIMISTHVYIIHVYGKDVCRSLTCELCEID